MALKKKRRSKKGHRPVKMPRKAPPSVPMIIFIVGAVLMMSSLAVQWGALSVKTRLGPIPVTLTAQVTEYGVSYEANLSGTQGLIQGAGDINRKISDNRVFLTGLGAFQETIGFIKGSSKYRNHTIELYTIPEDNKATVVVETYAATIPWWPIGIPEDVSVTVRIIDQPINMSYVEIQKVWFELHQTVDGQDRSKKLGESTPGDRLTAKGDGRTYSTKVVVNEDLGNFSIVGRVQLELIDINGKSNQGHELKSFSGNPKMITLWTVNQGQTARIGMLLAAMPLTVLAAVLLLLSLVPAYLRSKWAWKLAMSAAILAILAVIFYALGIGTLIELTGYGDWFYWTPMGPSLSVGGGVLGLVGAVLLFLDLRAGPGATKEGTPKEEAEGREAFGKTGTPGMTDKEVPTTPDQSEE
jgi:hypothetical protein